jgi:hypothetical protein
MEVFQAAARRTEIADEARSRPDLQQSASSGPIPVIPPARDMQSAS